MTTLTPDIIAQIKDLCEIDDRRYRLKVYKNVFLGSQLVQSLISEGLAHDEKSAVALAQGCMDKGVFVRCVQAHQFKNEPLFYQLVEHHVNPGFVEPAPGSNRSVMGIPTHRIAYTPIY